MRTTSVKGGAEAFCCRFFAGSIATWKSGKPRVNNPPQRLVTSRRSSTETVPRCSVVRSKRSSYLLERIAASGTVTSMKEDRPWDSIHSRRALSSDVSGV